MIQLQPGDLVEIIDNSDFSDKLHLGDLCIIHKTKTGPGGNLLVSIIYGNKTKRSFTNVDTADQWFANRFKLVTRESVNEVMSILEI